MKCLENLGKTAIPGDVFMSSLKLYAEIGKNEHYRTLFEPDFETLSKPHGQREAVHFFKCFFPDIAITEARQKSLLLASSVANNHAEVLYKNCVAVFALIHKDKPSPFELNGPEVFNLVKVLFNDYYGADKLTFNRVEKKTRTLISTEQTSKREALDELIVKYERLKKSGLYEATYLNLNFCVDFTHMEIFRFPDHQAVAMLLYYLLNLSHQIEAYHYVGFFQKLLLYRLEFTNELRKTKINWSDGLADCMPLHRMLLDINRGLYADLADRAREYQYENTLDISKTDYIENTIDKLEEVFTKEDIRLKHPLISDSTINRTLKRLQEENKVRPLGLGRNAKWIKLYKKPQKSKPGGQIGFDLGE